MSRRGLLLATIAPSMVLGGLLFGSAMSRADDGRDSDRWSHMVAQADPWQGPRAPAPPAPPAPTAAPAAPAAPVAPRNRNNRHGVSVQWHDGKLELDGIEELVQDQLERVNDVLDNLPDLSPDQRNKVKERVRRVRDKLRGRLRNMKSMDVSKVESEMERMGDEIEREMEGLDRELSQFGEELGQRFAKKLQKDIARGVRATPGHDNSNDDNDSNDANDDNDSNDDEDARAVTSGDVADMSQAIASLRNIALDKEQKVQLARLRADADRQIASAQRELDRLSERLQSDLGRARVDEAEVSRQIDEISAKEAQIRKARILTWVKVRGLLHDDQRRQVEAAAKHGR